MLIYANRGGGGKDVTISVTVTKASVMTPSDLKAHQNDRVTFSVTSDTDGEVHLHGYDIHFDTKAGQTVTQKFTADKTGDFPIEWEATSTELEIGRASCKGKSVDLGGRRIIKKK